MLTSAPAVGRRSLVLLIDDDCAARPVMVRALSMAGYDTLIATDGAAAAHLLRGLRMPPDLIIADLRIGRLGGEDLAEWLAQHAPVVPVVFVSGNAGLLESSPLRRHALRKPFSGAELLAAVERVLQAHRYRTRRTG
ncbi:MAG: response regulator [Gemmatimonadales bacterium]